MAKPAVIFVLGPPGAGKGTQCSKLAEQHNFTHLSAGDLLRSEVANKGPDGALIESLISKGNIVPSSITVGLLSRAMLPAAERSKFLIDGFPRNEENTSAWNEIMRDKVDVKFMLFYECSEEVCVARVLSRQEGRSDDTIDIVRKRIQLYRTSTVPVIEAFRSAGNIKVVDASGSVEEVFAETVKLIAHM